MSSSQHASGLVRRFGRTEIVYHWAQAVPYLFLVGTGSALLAHHFRPLGPEAREALRLAHLVTAALQVALPLLVALAGDTRALLANAREAWVWRRDDFVWLWRMHLKPLFPATELPPVGKFNAGQKVNFMLVMVAIPTFAASGLVMWLVPGALLPWYVHLATFAVSMPMLAVHLFMATLNPSTRHAMRAMVVGTVSREWAAHHHGAWLASVQDEPVRRDERVAPDEARVGAAPTTFHPGGA
jgi:formate dehydrogenase subunit gamma